jgi:hypothetical protein
MVRKTLPKEEIASIGRRIYGENIREKVEAQHHGKFLVIDIESGDYEIDDRDVNASLRLLARRPNGILYGIRIGYPAAYRLGGPILVAKP